MITKDLAMHAFNELQPYGELTLSIEQQAGVLAVVLRLVHHLTDQTIGTSCLLHNNVNQPFRSCVRGAQLKAEEVTKEWGKVHPQSSVNPDRQD